MPENTLPVERHPLQPYIPSGARLLMMGSFPPARHRWCVDFFYPNFTNDMWRIMGLCFYGDKSRFVDTGSHVFRVDEIKEFLNQRGIALYDTASEVIRTRNTASDKDLRVVKVTDFDSLLSRMPALKAVVTTGEKAAGLFAAHFGINPPKVGEWTPFQFAGRSLRLYRMPSSSRAYPMRVERKAECYLPMFQDIILSNNNTEL